MNRGNNKPEDPPPNLFASRNMLSYSPVDRGTGIDNHHNFLQQNPSESFKLAVEFFNNFASCRPDEGSDRREPTFPPQFRAGQPQMDIRALSQQLISLATPTGPGSFSQSNSLPTKQGMENWNSIGQSATPAANPVAQMNDESRSLHTTPCPVHNSDALSNAHRLASWSKALSAASPSAVAAFQNALAQLALLGLSSPSPTATDAQDGQTSNECAGPLESPSVAFDLSTSHQMEVDQVIQNGGKNHTKSLVEDAQMTSAHSSPPRKSETGSKIIIRQMADADEHFFKALRRLKVDVSPEVQATEGKNVLNLLPTPSELRYGSSAVHIPMATSPAATRSSTSEKRSATELAVEEHFEKSLAAFHASSSTNNRLSGSDSLGIHLAGSTQSSTYTFKPIVNPLIASDFSTSSDVSVSNQRGTKYLVRQFSQQEPIPPSLPTPVCLLGKTYSLPVDNLLTGSRHTTNTNELATSRSDYTQTRAQRGASDRNTTNVKNSCSQSEGNTISLGPDTSPSAAGQDRLRRKFASAAGVCTLLPVNSFKPKKNWLAQYDWRQNKSEQLTCSPTTPNGNQTGGFDSSASSPSPRQVGIDYSERLNISPDSVERKKSHHSSTTNKKGSDPPISPCDSSDVDVDLECTCQVEQEEISSFAAPDSSAKCDAQSADYGTAARQTNAQNLEPAVKAVESDRFRLQPTTLGSSVSKKDQDNLLKVQRLTELPSCFQAWEPPGQSLQSPQERKPNNSQKIFDRTDSEQCPSSADQPTLDCPSQKLSFHLTHDMQVKGDEGFTAENLTDRSISGFQHCDPKARSHWTFSQSSSPSPAYGEGMGTAAVTPVSGTTSGFFTGSTYSLDSSLGQAHQISFDPREVDSGIDLKSSTSTADDHVFTEGKQQALPELPSKVEVPDHSNPAWGLRKRASSEVSPWSTLKRSRSVLNSPLSYSEDQTGNELLSETTRQVGHDPNSMTGRYSLSELASTHLRSSGDSNRPLTPDLQTPQMPRRLEHSHKSSEMSTTQEKITNPFESKFSHYYLPYHSACEHETSSEPSTLAGSPGIKNISRSLSEASTIATLHLKHDKDVFVLR
ncbi:unnamed protein product [Calicophoron daubneyi]|uniref:Uncharacterized protein n=1 Tax=Calicophoron daubneyi TaxID=300641 RepID=A0AAV2TRV4_CALDB